MTANLQQKAISFCELKSLQKKLAMSGQHADAIALGKRIDPYAHRVAQAYLDVEKLPEDQNGVLVREIAVKVASKLNPKSVLSVKLRSVLCRAAWSKDVTTTQKLEDAKAALPDLTKVFEALR